MYDPLLAEMRATASIVGGAVAVESHRLSVDADFVAPVLPVAHFALLRREVREVQRHALRALLVTQADSKMC